MRDREGFSREVNQDLSAENGPTRVCSQDRTFQAEEAAGANALRREAISIVQEQGGELGCWASVKEQEMRQERSSLVGHGTEFALHFTHSRDPSEDLDRDQSYDSNSIEKEYFCFYRENGV